MSTVRKYVFWKPDLDTVLTAWLTGFESGRTLEHVQGPAPASDLACPDTVCIECGGSGEVWRNNFDHHGDAGCLPPACRQAFRRLNVNDPVMDRLVNYVCAVDLGIVHEGTARCTLSMVFSGLRLRYPHPVTQFLRGIALFQDVYTYAYDPCDMPLRKEWRDLVWEKIRARKRLQRYASQTQTRTTRSGKTLMYLHAPCPGVHGLLKKNGCDISVAGGIAKGHFTVSADLDLRQALDVLTEMEPGWGGPSQGGIFAAPPGGSRLSAEELLQILCASL